MNTKRVALSKLKPSPNKTRKISKRQFEKLKQSMTADPEMLEARPPVAQLDGTLIAGNQRYKAAKELGWETIPVAYVDLDERKARLWAIRDNATYGDWEEEELSQTLFDEIAEEDRDLTGLTDEQIEGLRPQAAPEADESESSTEKWVTIVARIPESARVVWTEALERIQLEAELHEDAKIRAGQALEILAASYLAGP